MNLQEGISIVMCCYNSTSVIKPTLQHLAALDLPSGWPVELIIIDNASTDGTSDFALKLWKDNGDPFAMIIHAEPNKGLIFARNKGVKVSRFEIILFVDDDNWLARNYLIRLQQLFKRFPSVAAFGGLNKPVFETKEPFWFETFQQSYAVGKLSKGFNEPEEIGLFGAGMAVRKTALNDLYLSQFKSRLIGRKGDSLTSGEDYELCKALKLAGWQIIFAPELSLEHFISARRLTWDYFRKLNMGISRSIYIFLAYEYWIGLGRGVNPYIAGIKYSWLFLLIKKVIKAFLLKMLLIVNPELSKEGSTVLIDYERTKIVVSDLFFKRKEFIDVKKSIGKAKWKL